MAFIPVFQDEFNCSICLDLLKDPVTVPCGHSFCLNCITDCWNQEDQGGVYSCPQCRQTFTHRPVLGKNTMMADMVEKLKKTELKSSSKAPSRPGDVECDLCTGRELKAVKSCLTCLVSYCELHIQPHYEVPRLSKHQLVNATSQLQEKICSQHDRIIEVFCRTDQKLICTLCLLGVHKGHETVSAAAERTDKQNKLLETKAGNQTQIQQRERELQQVNLALQTLKASTQKAVEETERMFTELISFLGQKRSEVTETIRALERAEVSRAEGVLEQLEQEITTLKSRDAEMNTHLQTEDHIDFLKSFDSFCTSSVPGVPPTVTFTPCLSITDIKTPAILEIEKMVLKLKSDHTAESHVSQFCDGPHPQSTAVSIQRDFKIGDKVRVKASVKQPKYGWGRVTHKSVGVIKQLVGPNLMHVNFPECSSLTWNADPPDLELVP